ncbi:MAG: DHH family phosphoesterase [Archaeoglobaceae archaeon]
MTSSISDLDLLKREAAKAANIVARHDFVRVYTHHDADGIAAGAIIAKALLRAGKTFQISFLKGLNEDFEYERGELLVFADMGSAYPDKMSEVDTDLIILDHHIPVGTIKPRRNFAHLNPHLFGFDGTYELSASGVAYFFANGIAKNRDLASIAILGILGDKQKFSGPNAEILREGKERGVVEVRTGINLPSGKLRKALQTSLEPYLDFYGNEDELDEFLSKVKVSGEKDVDELSFEEMQRLADAIALRMLKLGAYEGVFGEVFGKKILLTNLPIKSATTLTEVVNSCGRAGAMSVALAMLLGDTTFLEKALRIHEEFLTQLLEELSRRKKEVRDGFCIRYLVMKDAPSASPIATVFSRYLYSDKPLVVINVKNGEAKVSARTTEKLSERLNLADVMRLAAEKVGGVGGGHRVAAGANIPPDKVEEFLKEVDRLCCTMLA